MALSNAEKQAAWRARQAANKERVAELEREVARLKGSLTAPNKDAAQFIANFGALLFGLAEEGRKDLATFSPNTVRRYTTLMMRQLDAMFSGDTPPKLDGWLRQCSALMLEHATTPSSAAPAAVRKLRKLWEPNRENG